ncbi:MAG: hypothetical protein HY298_06680 [Verrucomicrobia bacterium]|nr:hypothetical protein [Verrucomicrobiota bacterium]
MRKVVSLREVVVSVRNAGGGWELCATADAKYDTASSTVVVELDSLVQPTDLPPGVDGFRQPWLPAKEVVRRRVPLPEARVAARNVFQHWTMKVRRAIPAPSQHSAD